MPSLSRLAMLGLLALAIPACVTANAESAGDDNIALPERSRGADPESDRAQDVLSAEAGVPEKRQADAGGGGAADAAPVPKPVKVGAWAPAVQVDCVTFCAGRGAINVASPEGAKCTSGENIPQSALTAGITYKSCYPNCNAHLAGPNPKSDNEHCYADGQKHDDDSSDDTRGCFCL